METKCGKCGKEIYMDKKMSMLHRIFDAPEIICGACATAQNPGMGKDHVRSVEQNRYYWGIVIRFIMKFRNWSEKQAHAWVKITWKIETTKKLSTGEFEKILSSIRSLVREFWGLNIPCPNDDLEFLGKRFDWERLYEAYN